MSGVRTTTSMINQIGNVAFISKIEPKISDEALSDQCWIFLIQEQLDQSERNQVSELVLKPKGHSIIGTKWIFHNKLDVSREFVRNKARLVTQGYNQEEGIDYDKTYAPVVRIKSINLLLVFACFKNFKLS